MCIVFWTLQHDEYALILCTNRDEFLDRPTLDAHFHSFGQPQTGVVPDAVLSGIDKLAGGTWFGMNKESGKIALLTNITEPPPQLVVSSRGSLVSSFLLSSTSQQLPPTAKYAGFNMLLLAPATDPGGHLHFEASFVSNGGAGGTITSRPLSQKERAIGAFSNGIDGKGGSEWPKVKLGMEHFASVMKTLSNQDSPDSESELSERLFDLLRWASPKLITERAHLRETIQVRPLPINLGSSSSSSSESIAKFYATRLSTVLLVRKDGRVVFIERDVWKNGPSRTADDEPGQGPVLNDDSSSDRRFTFQMQLGRTESD